MSHHQLFNAIESEANHTLDSVEMAHSIFCCGNAQPYPRPTRTDNDGKFSPFIKAAFDNDATGFASSSGSSGTETTAAQYPYVIQLVKQVNYGPLESKRFFAPLPPVESSATEGTRYIELSEADLIAANFAKVNTYKNFRCLDHNRFFEVNLYQKDPVNKHHWRVNVARPAGEIDL